MSNVIDHPTKDKPLGPLYDKIAEAILTTDHPKAVEISRGLVELGKRLDVIEIENAGWAGVMCHTEAGRMAADLMMQDPE